MVSSSIIQKKVNAIQHNLLRIYSFQPFSAEEFLINDDLKDIISHNLFVMLQNIIDIGTHLISDAGMAEPDYLSEIPALLNKGNIIPSELVQPLKSMIGLRNLIAHEYGVLDFNTIYHIVTNDLGDVGAFLDSVIRHCGL